MPRQSLENGTEADYESKYSESGIIKAVHLVDFRSHRNLSHTLNPNINFITGRNGSGKSAILLGIKSVFGGKAEKLYIHEHSDHAIITVILKNEGVLAYRPDLFGKEIAIQRHLYRPKERASIYKVYGEGYDSDKVRNREVKIDNMTVKNVIDVIVAHFGIQYDNPCVLMTQETSKEYLKNSTPSSLYEFFAKATLLKQSENKLLESEMHRGYMWTSLEDAERAVSKVESEYKEAEKKWERVEALQR